MTRRSWALSLVVALCSQPNAAAQAPANSGLAQGIQQVEEGDLDAAVITLDDLVRRLSAQPGQERDLTTAYLYLGMAQLGLNQMERARASVGSAAKISASLVLDPQRFPPRLIRMFEEAKRENAASMPPVPASQPASPPPPPFSAASTKKGGGSKALLIVAGLAAAGGGVALAAKKDPLDVDDDRDGASENQGDCDDRNASVGPRGTLLLSNARFESTLFNCPRSTIAQSDVKAILFTGVNNTCSLGRVLSVSVTVTISAASGTTNFSGQTFTFNNVAFSPTTVAAAGSQAFRVTVNMSCTNTFTGATRTGVFNDHMARLTIQTSSGQTILTTTNTNRTAFP